jgi:hypothetical protein
MGISLFFVYHPASAPSGETLRKPPYDKSTSKLTLRVSFI